MTEIKIDKFKRGYDISIKGHAGAVRNEQDNDLVCCAISTLVCAACNMIELLTESGKAQESIAIAEPGMSRLYIKAMPQETRYIQGVMDTFIIGLEGIREVYPEYINIKCIGGD